MGKLFCMNSLKKKLFFGPKQIAARMNQNTQISQQLTLWNQQGSEVIYGGLLTIPIKESVLYLQPLYLQASSGKIPELKRIIASFNKGEVFMEKTLESVLERIFSENIFLENRGVTENNLEKISDEKSNIKQQAQQAFQLFQKSQSYLKDADFAKYGEMQKKLKALLQKMQN